MKQGAFVEVCLRGEIGAGWSEGCICSECHPEDGSVGPSVCAFGHELFEPDAEDMPMPLCTGGEDCEWNREPVWGENGLRAGTRPRFVLRRVGPEEVMRR